MGAEHLVVATIRRPHGVRGELVVSLETDRPGSVFGTGRRLQMGDPQGQPLGEWLTIERARPFKDGLLLKAVELTTRDEALESLRGRSLLIPVEDAAPTASDEVHYRELIGMEVTVEGEPVGRVAGVMETPAGELLVIRRPRARDLLLPFVKEWVREIDRQQGRLELDPPEGLLDL